MTPDPIFCEKSLNCRLSKRQVANIARQLYQDETGIARLCHTMLHTTQPKVAYNAAWIMNHLSLEKKRWYVSPYYQQITRMAMSPELPFRRALLLSLVQDLSTADNFSTEMLDFCLTHMSDHQESNSSRAAMIRLAGRICCLYPELAGELAGYLEALQFESAPSITAPVRQTLRRIRTLLSRDIEC